MDLRFSEEFRIEVVVEVTAPRLKTPFDPKGEVGSTTRVGATIAAVSVEAFSSIIVCLQTISSVLKSDVQKLLKCQFTAAKFINET